ncbi:MAG: hypothetical protein KAR40_07920 [Candidatus Sabulitectum sp.]|nr:hypothetical protein [Candidatus Sabulitectum sp.]
MGQITNYGTLKDELAKYVHRTDLTSDWPMFIQLGQSRINSDLDDYAMETRASYTIPAGQRYTTLPADMRKLMNVQVAVGGGRKAILPLSQEQMDTIWSFVDTGTPENYSLTGDQMEVQPTPGEDTEMEIFYQYRLTSFVDDTDTNDILDKFPNIYVYSALIEWAIWAQADERVPVFQKAYAAEVGRINEEAEERRQSGGSLQIYQLGTSTP